MIYSIVFQFAHCSTYYFKLLASFMCSAAIDFKGTRHAAPQDSFVVLILSLVNI